MIPLSAEDGKHPLRSLLEDIYSNRLDLQHTFKSPDSPEFWTWFNTHGIDEYPSVGSLVPPIPNESLRVKVHGDTDEKSFLSNGGKAFALVRDFIKGTVLDFGCGCGRIARYFFSGQPRCKLYGTDIDDEAVRWCTENLRFCTFSTNSVTPPTLYKEGFFRCIYSISIFSHLNEIDHLCWLEELIRITKPKGYILVTIHGKYAFDRTIERESKLSPDKTIYRQAMTQFKKDGFAFVYPDDLPSHVNRERYGTTFISRDYIVAKWPGILAEYREAALDWQDLVVLHKSR